MSKTSVGFCEVFQRREPNAPYPLITTIGLILATFFAIPA